MSAPADPFLAGFIGLAHAEAARDPAMADAMANLVDALERCTRVTPGVRPTYPVIDEHLGTCLGAAVGAPPPETAMRIRPPVVCRIFGSRVLL